MRNALLWLALLAAAGAQAASFDCRKAATTVERHVCSDRDLSSLDDLLAEVFADELGQEAQAPRLRAAQKRWLAVRNACADAPCVREKYEQRLAALTCDARSRLGGSATRTGQCAHFSLRLLERELAPLEERSGLLAAAGSTNPEYTRTTVAAEQKTWRAHRKAQCELHGAAEGGTDGWKNAWAGVCEVEETRKRIARLKEELRVR